MKYIKYKKIKAANADFIPAQSYGIVDFFYISNLYLWKFKIKLKCSGVVVRRQVSDPRGW